VEVSTGRRGVEQTTFPIHTRKGCPEVRKKRGVGFILLGGGGWAEGFERGEIHCSTIDFAWRGGIRGVLNTENVKKVYYAKK